ncbi:hypothetical protein PIB30_067385 [Stylosanthes scabra]|uniref:Uncharacterized protein n=1 Tax=Stylosanthes scabra TaxID=79078 RepID=A0ABU6WL06_9FABA|nr:hypothetical protein [Stylosanthes scabra]
MKPLPLIPVIELDGGDPDLADLLQMISESKVGSEPSISNSVNKSVPQEKEKEDTPIQKARSESLQKILLKSAAEKMIRLMDQPLDMLQKDPYWNDELVKLKKPFEKIQDKKAELGNQLSEIEKSKLQNEADLKRLQEEELQELDLFKGFEDNKIQLKDTWKNFFKNLGIKSK